MLTANLLRLRFFFKRFRGKMRCERVAQPPPGRDVGLSDFVAGANMVGRRVAVLWNEPDGGQTWYDGSVLQSNPAGFVLTIKYDATAAATPSA